MAGFEAPRAQHESVTVGGLCVDAVLALHEATPSSTLMSAVQALMAPHMAACIARLSTDPPSSASRAAGRA